MYCPYCGAACQDHYRFCAACGGSLPAPAKKGTHRVPLLILTALAVLGTCIFYAVPLSAPALPEATVQPETGWFTAADGNLRFDQDRYTGGQQLTVPDRVGWSTVEWIDDGCFRDCDMLSEILLPDTVLHIGTAAFADCDALRGMDLPQGLNTLGREAFAGCDALEAVHIPGSVNFIGADAFAGCPRLCYIFYDGTRQKWNQVCGQDLGPRVTVICADGVIQ